MTDQPVDPQAGEGWHPELVQGDDLDAQRVEAWLSQLGEDEGVIRALAGREWRTQQDWLLARLLLDLLRDGVEASDLPSNLPDTYRLIHDRAEHPPGSDSELLSAVTELLAASSTTPVPLTLLAAALGHFQESLSLPQLRDLVVRLRSIVIRGHPQTRFHE